MQLLRNHLGVLDDLFTENLPKMVGKDYNKFNEFKELITVGYITAADFSSRDGEFYGDVELTNTGQIAFESQIANR